MIRALPVGLLLLTVALQPGCGSKPVPAVDREAAIQAHAAGVAAFEKQNYQVAKDHFQMAVDSGLLNSDVLVNALIQLAVADAALGNLDEASKTLDRAARGAPSADQLLAAQSFILAKQGKTREAKAAWAKAKKINRRVKKFGG